jgi:hypothetical protein
MTTISWISIDPILGEPKTYPESNLIETEFQNGKETIFLETFCRTIHFKEPYTQTTPRIGAKPKGIRSVVRCNLGEQVIVYLWPNSRWYSTQPRDIKEIKYIIIQEAENIPETWQWCDRDYDNTKYALERNWHNFSGEISNQIEETSKHRGSMTITIGLTPYVLSDFNGSYGIQTNSVTGMTRAIRRGISKFVGKELSENLQDESCALCMEDFKDTPHVPLRTTSCNHTFHWTCLNNYKSRESCPRCPMCRASI